MTTQELKAIRREAKQRCLARLALARAKSKAEQDDREYATRTVRRMQEDQRYQRVPTHELNRVLFERLLRAALETHFQANPWDTEVFLTTDQVIVMVNEITVPVKDQHEVLRLLSKTGYLGFTYEAANYWRFPRIEPLPRLNATSNSTSIFDK